METINKEQLTNDVYGSSIKYEDFQDKKLKYLLDNYVNKKTIMTYFKSFRMFVLPVEIELNKELKEMTEEEVECMVNNIPTTSLRIKTSLIKLCVNYRASVDSNNTEL